MKKDMTEQGGGLLQNDRTLLGGLFGFYLICICAVLGFLGWWFARREATSRANATATAIARLEEQDQYEYIERFDTVSGQWRIGFVNNERWIGKVTFQDGSYLWKVDEVKETFFTWADFHKDDSIEDFDVYVDTKILGTSPGGACSGFLFRISPDGWDEGGYYYALCNNATAVIDYFTGQDGWEQLETVGYLSGYSPDWNRLEIRARGSHFSFLVNGVQIHEMDDARQPKGGLALMIEMYEKVPATILFDNFGFQSR